MTQSSQEYTTAGTYSFSVPAGVSCVFASGIAGGAGGGTTLYSNNGIPVAFSAGAGGAGESCDNLFVPVTPGGTLTVVVGAGGFRGDAAITPMNVHAGPPGNTGGIADGAGGGDTIIGDKIRLVGGYGGLRSTSGSGNHGGMGGGWRAYKGPNSSGGGAGVADNGQNIAGLPGGFKGYHCFSLNGPRHCGAPGGGSGNSSAGGGNPGTGGDGGDWGPFPGGIAGAVPGTLPSGAAGGASIYGPGGDGGDGSDTSAADAPAVPAGSYGCGGGGSGGSAATVIHINTNHYLGATGHDGYVILTWFEP